MLFWYIAILQKQKLLKIHHKNFWKKFSLFQTNGIHIYTIVTEADTHVTMIKNPLKFLNLRGFQMQNFWIFYIPLIEYGRVEISEVQIISVVESRVLYHGQNMYYRIYLSMKGTIS